MKKARFLVLALALCLTFCACGQSAQQPQSQLTQQSQQQYQQPSHQHSWTEATCTQPRTCKECGATEGNPVGHKWNAATFDAPKTCSVCGATEGEKLKTFFEQKGIVVREKLEPFYPNAMYAARRNNPKTVRLEKAIYTFKSYSVKPSSQRPGYKAIRLVVSAKNLHLDNLESAITLGDLYDAYTGYMFANHDVVGDKTNYYTDTVNINGKDVTIYYSMEVTWGKARRSSADNLYYRENEVAYYIEIPEDYDGLVLVFENFTEDDWGPDEKTVRSGIVQNPDKDAFYFHIGNQ